MRKYKARKLFIDVAFKHDVHSHVQPYGLNYNEMFTKKLTKNLT
jgi:hypothetical protein